MKLKNISKEDLEEMISQHELWADYRPGDTMRDGQRADFSNMNLRCQNFMERDLRGAIFDGADLTNAVFNGANLSDYGLVDEAASFKNANCKNTSFLYCYAACADFEGAILDNANFSEARLEHSIFNEVEAIDCNFKEAVLSRSEINNSDFIRCNFAHAALDSNDIHNVKIYESLMNCAEMDLSPIIDDSKMNFYDTDLRTAYIEDDICDSEHDDLIAELQNGSKDTEELLYLLKNDKTINPDEKEEMLIAYNVELDPIDHNRPLSELLQEATSVAQDYNQNLQQEQSQDMNKDTIEY